MSVQTERPVPDSLLSSRTTSERETTVVEEGGDLHRLLRLSNIHSSTPNRSGTSHHLIRIAIAIVDTSC